MNHISENTLNEYVDGALAPSDFAEVSAHLAACQQCAARWREITSLFEEIASLPEIPLDRDLSQAVLARLAATPVLPSPVRWVLGLQVLTAFLVLALAFPLTDITAYLAVKVMIFPPPVDLFGMLSTQTATWVRSLQLLSLPTLPVWNNFLPVRPSDLVLTFTLLSVSVVWLVANRFLLRPPGGSLSRR